MIAAGLLAYAGLLLAVAPALARAAWPDRAPRLAIAAWLALTGSVVASVVFGGLVLVVPAARVSAGLARLLAACAHALRVHYAHPGGTALAAAGALLAVTVTVRLACCTIGALAARARAARRHRRGLRLAGRDDPRLGAIVIDHHQPAAYCLPGAGQPVVLTTAALRALDGTQMAAVLAHEKAHQSGRHHLLIALAGALATAFPTVPAFRRARDEIARLAELAADDAAAAVSPRIAVAEALLALSAGPAGTAALSAGGAAAARIRRMIAAPDPLPRATATGWRLAVVLLLAVPLGVLAAPAVAALADTCCTPPAATMPCTHPGTCSPADC